MKSMMLIRMNRD